MGARSARSWSGVDPTTVRRYVAARDGGATPFATVEPGLARRAVGELQQGPACLSG